MVAEVERLHTSPFAGRMLDLARMRRLIEEWPSSGFDRLDVNRSHHIALTRGFSVGRFLSNTTRHGRQRLRKRRSKRLTRFSHSKRALQERDGHLNSYL